VIQMVHSKAVNSASYDFTSHGQIRVSLDTLVLIRRQTKNELNDTTA